MIDAEPCRVTEFAPLARVTSGEVAQFSRSFPYGSVTIECTKLPPNTKGFITHKVDFLHLWNAFKIRGVSSDEEVIIFWTKKNYTSLLAKLFSPFMPRLWVLICNKGAYEIMTGQIENADPLFDLPIISWKPTVMQ